MSEVTSTVSIVYPLHLNEALSRYCRNLGEIHGWLAAKPPIVDMTAEGANPIRLKFTICVKVEDVQSSCRGCRRDDSYCATYQCAVTHW